MTHTNVSSRWRDRVSLVSLACLAVLTVTIAVPAHAQARVGNHTRLERFGIDLGYGALMGLAFAGVDQARNDPPEWGGGGKGYGRRAASNVGEFVVQESVTEGLAAIMNRPLDYTRCKCTNKGARIRHAFLGAVTDEMPDGSHKFAVPRVTGAYVGSFAQGAWRPNGGRNWAQIGLGRGTVSLAIGAGINLFHEFVK
jgi:hypothetical protein